MFIAIVAGTSGCSRSSRAAVSGKVAMNGEPIASGDIAFVPVSLGQGAAGGAPIERGQYDIRADQGLAPGDYKVAIHAFHRTGKKTWDGMGEPSAPASQKHYVEELEQYIPTKYNDATELKATIVAGKVNRLSFDLRVSAGGK